MHIDQVTEAVIGSAIRVHRALGPGLLESAYEACLCHELARCGLHFERQKALPVVYDGIRVDCGYRLDVFVERMIVVEIKAVERLEPIHTAQLLTYLKLTECNLGLLLNFNVQLLKHGIRRVASGWPGARPQ